MTPLLVLEQRFLQVDVSLGHQHLLHPLVLDVRVSVKVSADCLAGLGEGHIEIIQYEDSRELPGWGGAKDTANRRRNTSMRDNTTDDKAQVKLVP